MLDHVNRWGVLYILFIGMGIIGTTSIVPAVYDAVVYCEGDPTSEPAELQSLVYEVSVAADHHEKLLDGLRDEHSSDRYRYSVSVYRSETDRETVMREVFAWIIQEHLYTVDRESVTLVAETVTSSSIKKVRRPYRQIDDDVY